MVVVVVVVLVIVVIVVRHAEACPHCAGKFVKSAQNMAKKCSNSTRIFEKVLEISR